MKPELNYTVNQAALIAGVTVEEVQTAIMAGLVKFMINCYGEPRITQSGLGVLKGVRG
ncbi:Uncharacterised protein [Acetobacterium wieringae]|uniref:hypothetical protein n=1 Tax=Acetobacterium wieringae TaxID=52694 RepID=UPI001DD328BE|nr:hypothetical protein [Acetobacterium wieringae]VUZ28492.1 Uncharacterised protein [Acetobacterium wieringae]